MAGGKPTTEIPVAIDADGKAIFDVFRAVEKKLVDINGQVAKIGSTAGISAEKFKASLDVTVKQLRDQMATMRTLAAAQNTPGMNIQLQNAQKTLAAQTRGATEYAQGLNTARTAAEALRGKINDLNREIAGRGAQGQGATIAQRDRLSLYEKQLAALKALDAQQERNDRRAARTKGGDLSAELRAVEATRARLEAATLNPNKNGLAREIKAAQLAQDQYTDAINRTRSAQAQLLREQQGQTRALVGRDVRGMVTANNGNSQAVATSLRAQQQAAESRLAMATGAGIAPAREALLLAEKRVQAIDKIVAGERRAAAEVAKSNAGQKPNSILPAGGFPTVFARTAAYGAAGSVLFGLVSTLKQGADFAVQFEDKLKTLQAVANATDMEMVGLTSAITNVGATSRDSLVELTDMATKLAQAGVSASSMGEALSSVSMLATASGSTPAEAVDLITAALGSFQLQASETPRIADLITSALNRTRLTVQQAALAIQYVGATAFEQNISLEQLLATTAALSQAGIRSGSTIGTGMRQFLVDLQSPSEKLTTALTDLGISSADVDVKVRGLPAVLETLNKAGFGAAQAYGSLETRAAAFYLVAKNNTDVMAQLQLDFAETGAAAVAQERAMDSLSAQWQRFKNIVGESFAESAEGTMQGFKNMLRQISDNLTEARRIAEQSRPARDAKLAKGLGGVDNLGSFDAYATDKLFDGLRWMFNEDGASGIKLGDVLFGVGRGADAAGMAMERLTGQMNVQEGATTEVRDKIGGLDKEIARLILQEDSLKETTNGVAVETVNLSGRFEGLAKYITNTDGTVRGLIGAMKALRNEESGLLIDRLGQQVSTAQTQIAQGTIKRDQELRKARQNPRLMGLLTDREKVAMASLDSGNPGVASNARQILRDARSDLLAKGLTDLALALGPLTDVASSVATASGDLRILSTEIGNERFRNSPLGQKLNGGLGDAQGIADQLRSASAEDRVKLMGRLEGILKPLETIMVKNIGTNPENNKYQVAALAALRSLRQGAQATVKPAEEKAGAVGRTRLITADDILRIAQDISPGVRTDGSERRSREWQNAAHARGITPANADTSYHTRNDGVAKDIPGRWGATEGKRLAAAMNERARQQGLKVFYQWESGSGRNGGTGEHIHGQALKNQRIADGDYAREDRAERKIDISTDKLGLGVKSDRLQSALRSLGDATTDEAFKTAVLSSETALDEWAKQLRAVAAEELTAQGALPNQIADRNREVDNQIAQKREEMVAQIKRKAEDFQKDQLKTILKSLDNMLDAAQLAFDQAMQPAADRITALQAQAEGLGFASNAGNVPDYVQALQDRRIAVAQEEMARERSSRLPGLISSKNSAIFGAETDLAIKDWSKLPEGDYDAAVNKIAALRAEVAGLVAEKKNLDLALGAGGLIPTTLGEGLQQAVEAFQQANNAGQSFTDMLIQNMGGALQTTSDGLTEMFTNIMTGSMTVLEAFKGFVSGMIKYMIQLAARAVALKVFNLLLNAVGGSVAGPSASGSMDLPMPAPGAFGFNGAANINGEWVPALMGGGGRVSNGSATRDSVMAKVAKDEWLVNSKATKSVGHEFMAKLNNQGAAALDAMRGSPVIVPQAPQEMNVWLVKEGQKPQLGKNDILLAVHEDIMSNGETKKLIKHVSQGG